LNRLIERATPELPGLAGLAAGVGEPHPHLDYIAGNFMHPTGLSFDFLEVEVVRSRQKYRFIDFVDSAQTKAVDVR
jgi:hypothetical protein